MKTAKDVLKSIKDNDVKYVDLRFTDPRGKWQHVTFDVGMIEDDTFAEGVMFDGSSIAGWKAINESDMCLMPDPVTATIDPFFAETTMVITCDVLEPTTGEPYNRDPRGMAKKAEAMVKSMGVGDTVFFGPEAEFFVFDDVRYQTTPYNTGFKLDSSELPINSDTEYEGGNLGHRIRTKAGYFPVPPQDSVQDMRSEMLGAMAKMGHELKPQGVRVTALCPGPVPTEFQARSGIPEAVVLANGQRVPTCPRLEFIVAHGGAGRRGRLCRPDARSAGGHSGDRQQGRGAAGATTPHRVMLEIIARQALRKDGADGAPKKAVREVP